MYNAKVLVNLYGNMPSYKGFVAFAPTVLLCCNNDNNNSNDDNKMKAMSLCPNVFCSASLRELCHCLPKVAIGAVYIERQIHIQIPGSVKSVPLSKQSNATVTVNPRDEANTLTEFFDLNIATQLQPAANIPPPIQDLIYSIYTKCKDSVKTEWTKAMSKDLASRNCVLVIDNRQNIMSVLSAYVTLSNLRSDTWDLVVMTTESSKPFYEHHLPFVKTYIQHPLLQNDIKFNIEVLNTILKDKLTWLQLCAGSYEYCLMIQDDGLIVRKGLEEQFLREGYDYVGAPWTKNQMLEEAGVGPDMVGNGGLSLRNIQTMLDICGQASHAEKNRLFFNDLQPVPEDVFFSSEIQKRGGKMPSFQKATRFSLEQTYCQEALGFHKPWPYIKWEQLQNYFIGISSASA